MSLAAAATVRWAKPGNLEANAVRWRGAQWTTDRAARWGFQGRPETCTIRIRTWTASNDVDVHAACRGLEKPARAATSDTGMAWSEKDKMRQSQLPTIMRHAARKQATACCSRESARQGSHTYVVGPEGEQSVAAADLGTQYPRIVPCLEGPQFRMKVPYSVNSGRISHFPHFPPQPSITPAFQLAEPLFQCDMPSDNSGSVDSALR